jgi:hypothetical protein
LWIKGRQINLLSTIVEPVLNEENELW